MFPARPPPGGTFTIASGSCHSGLWINTSGNASGSPNATSLVLGINPGQTRNETYTYTIPAGTASGPIQIPITIVNNNTADGDATYNISVATVTGGATVM